MLDRTLIRILGYENFLWVLNNRETLIKANLIAIGFVLLFMMC